jgi:hypothetical protein
VAIVSKWPKFPSVPDPNFNMMTAMKRIRTLVIGFLACAVCVIVSYHFGYERALRIQNSTFIVSLSALQDLHASNINEATRKMEDLCFGSAELLYSDPTFRKERVSIIFAPELKLYRATWRTNSSDWSPVEKDLEKDLDDWK